MNNRVSRIAVAACGLLAVATAAHAQTTVTLPDTTLATTMTAVVSEQATVIVPATVTFNVADLAAATAASPATVTVNGIVLSSATRQLRVSIQAGAASFTPANGGTTWSASDVSWNAGTWTNATGTSGTLSAASYGAVATCDANAASCTTSDLTFTLGAQPAVQRSGNHTLSVTWKFEAIGS
jgi:hypothetical protein